MAEVPGNRTSTVRSVRVELDAQVASYIANMKLAGSATNQAFGAAQTRRVENYAKALDKTSASMARVPVVTQRAEQVTQSHARSVRSASNDLNKYTGRLNAMVKAAITIGPAIIPVTSAAIPVVAGLADGLGALAGVIGVAALAAAGMGDALKALDAYALEPTAENAVKVQQALAVLGPQGAQFIEFLHSAEPTLRQLQNTARAGLLPGLEQGIGSLILDLPQVEQIIAGISREAGRLAAQGGEAFGRDQGVQALLRYIETDGAPTLHAFAVSTGQVASGLASLLAASAPLNTFFTTGLVAWTRNFQQWAAGLSSTQGFQDFVSYIEQHGPQVADLLGALAQALVAVLKAASPWADVVLPVLTSAAKLLAAIAGSKAGPALFTIAAGMVALNTASKASWLVNSPKTITAGVKATSTSLGQLRSDLGVMASTWMTAGATSEREAIRVGEAQTRVKTTLASVGSAARALAGPAGILLVTQGIDQTNKGLGVLEEAAGGAAIGLSVGGPWGAAIGGSIGLLGGLLQSARSAGDEVKQLTADWSKLGRTMPKGHVTEATRALIAQQLLISGNLDVANGLGFSDRSTVSATAGQGGLDSILAASRSREAQLQAQLAALQHPLRNVRAAPPTDEVRSILAQITAQQNLQKALSQAAGKVDQASSAQRRLAAATSTATTAQLQQIQAIAAHNNQLSKLQLQTQYAQAVQAAAKAAHAGAKGISDYTDAGLKNHQALIGLVQAYNAQTVATKNNVQGYVTARQILVSYAHQMGATKAQAEQLAALLDKPHTFYVQGLDEDIIKAGLLKQALDRLHDKQITVYVRQQVDTVTGDPETDQRIARHLSGGASSIPVPKPQHQVSPVKQYLDALKKASDVTSSGFGSVASASHKVSTALKEARINAESREKELKAHITVLKKDRTELETHRKAVISDRKQLAQAIAGNFRPDVFGSAAAQASTYAYRVDPTTGKYISLPAQQRLQAQGIAGQELLSVLKTQSANASLEKIRDELSEPGGLKYKKNINAVIANFAQNATPDQLAALAANPDLAIGAAQSFITNQRLSGQLGQQEAARVTADRLKAVNDKLHVTNQHLANVSKQENTQSKILTALQKLQAAHPNASAAEIAAAIQGARVASTKKAKNTSTGGKK